MFGKILITDDSLFQAKLLEGKLEAEYYDVVLASSGEEALEKIKTESPDLIIMDIMMNGIDGIETCKIIKSNADTFHIPVLMVTAYTDQESRVKALEAGADDVLTKPINDNALFARVNSLLRLKMMAEQWLVREKTIHDNEMCHLNLGKDFDNKCKYGNILILGEEGEELYHLRKTLNDKHYRILYTKCVEDAEKLSLKKDFDLFVVSFSIGIEKALRFSAKLKNNKDINKTPILIIGENEDEQHFIKALEIGCNDYIIYPFNDHEYSARVCTQLKKKRYQEQLESDYKENISLAVIDDLTGVSNRRYLHTYLENMFAETKSKNQTIALLMIDIDHFKNINDTYGHLIGDEVLVEFSNRLKNDFRNFDLIARYGGDEFIAIIPYVDKNTAEDIANRVIESMHSKPFSISVNPNEIDLNISIGIAVTDDFDRNPDEFINDADKALYDAKESGRNTVSVY